LRTLQVLAAIEGQYDSGPEVSHRIVHQDGDRVTFRDCGRMYATKNVGDLFAIAATKRGEAARLLARLASPSNPNNSVRGNFFEAVMHARVCSGGSFQYKFVDVPCGVPATGLRGKPTKKRTEALQTALDAATAEARTAGGIAKRAPLQMTVPKMETHSFAGGSQVNIGDFGQTAEQCPSPSYLRPDNEFHPVIDACILPDTLLNFKAGKVGSLNEQLLEDHLQCLPDLDRYYFDYIVPADVYSTFKPAPLVRAPAHTRVSKTHVRVVKVEAKLRPMVPATVHMRMVRAMRGACLMARPV
jgi:hypothetical protein